MVGWTYVAGGREAFLCEPRSPGREVSAGAGLGLQWAGEITGRGLIDGKCGEHDDAPFAVYAIGR